MKANDFGTGLALRKLDRSARRDDDRPGVKAALLGLVCVAGVFGLLGLLYAL